MRRTLLATFVFLSFFLAHTAEAETFAPGTITEDTTWTKENGPYVVSTMLIPEGVTLTIGEGTIVKLGQPSCNCYENITVSGRMIVGSPDASERAIITSINDDVGGDTNGDDTATMPASGDWRQIAISAGGVLELYNSDVRYGGRAEAPFIYFNPDNVRQINNSGGTVIMDNADISFGHIANYRDRGAGTTIIRNSHIHDANLGIALSGGTATIEDNTFSAVGTAIEYPWGMSLAHRNNSGVGGITQIGVLSHDVTLTPDTLAYTGGWITVPSGVTLRLLPGTVMKNTGIFVSGILEVGTSTSTEEVVITSSRDDAAGGDTNGDGDASLPIAGDWGTIYINPGGVGNIFHTTVRYGGAYVCDFWGKVCTIPMLENNGELTLSDTTISDAKAQLLVSSGVTTVVTSEFARGTRGVEVRNGTAVIHGSSIHDNTEYGVFNATQNTIDATNNWWGSFGGPTHPTNPLGAGDRVSDNVDFGPWLTKESSQKCQSECYSVLFIPGFAGSKLYRDSDNVWFPDRDQDARELFMNEFGVSINADITVEDGEVAETAYLFEDVYAGLPELLDTLKSTQVIADWKSTPYDWRLDYETLLAGGKQTGDHVNYALGTSTPYILQTLQELIDKAKNHKVIIITHSNGGLLAKALVKQLEEKNDPLLEGIEQVIMVAPPQLGAPKAIVSMLHGDENPLSTKRWDIVENDTFRNLVEYIPTMYNFLPSEQFVNSETGPFILFDNPDDDPYDRAGKKAVLKYGHYDTDPTLNMYRARYPDGLTTINELYTFLTGENGLRDKPENDDLDTPNVLKEALLTDAQNMHAALDQYAFPASIAVTQIVGWGLPTITGIEYHRNTDDPTCIERFPCKVSYRMGRGPITTTDGDGTVPTLSASAVNNAASIFVDLKTYNGDIKKKLIIDHPRAHSDILGSEPVKNILKKLVRETYLGQIPYTSTIKPSGAKYLTIEKHSPVDLDLYDDEGNHTGFIDVLVDGTPRRTVEEEIPGSSYIIMGSSTYVFFPADNPTTITLRGTATGSATIKITERIDDVVTATTTFYHIPVTPATVGTITLSSLASTSHLTIDNNGDGIVELMLTPIVNGSIIADPLTNPIALTVTADSKTVVLGSPTPPLTTSISGFVDGDTIATSVTGAPLCATTATSGSPVGMYPITCTQGTLDSEKYYVASFATGTLNVQYAWSGFTQPINDTEYNPTQSISVFKGGSTVPVKFQLKNANSISVQSSTSPIWLTPQRGAAMSASIDETTYSYPATSGTTFKWDDAGQQYIYNWSTKGLTAGYLYRIYTKLDDGTTQSVVVGLR